MRNGPMGWIVAFVILGLAIFCGSFSIAGAYMAGRSSTSAPLTLSLPHLVLVTDVPDATETPSASDLDRLAPTSEAETTVGDGEPLQVVTAPPDDGVCEQTEFREETRDYTNGNQMGSGSDGAFAFYRFLDGNMKANASVKEGEVMVTWGVQNPKSHQFQTHVVRGPFNQFTNFKVGAALIGPACLEASFIKRAVEGGKSPEVVFHYQR